MKRKPVDLAEMTSVAREQRQPGLHGHRCDPQIILADPRVNIGMMLLQ